MWFSSDGPCFQLPCILLSWLVSATSSGSSPHPPKNLTWQVTNAATGAVLTSTTTLATPNTWFPDLFFDLGRLLQITWSDEFIQKHEFYVCPGHNGSKSRFKQCGGADAYYCASWSCVSTGQISWKAPNTGDLITLHRRPKPWPPCKQGRDSDGSIEGDCNPVQLSFTSEGKKNSSWETGFIWGIRLYDNVRLGWKDPGALFSVTLKVETPPPLPVGPNKVLNPEQPRLSGRITPRSLPPSGSPGTTPRNSSTP